jgi:small subunit ribosomal protein S6
MNTYEAMLLLDNREVKKGWDSLKEKVDGVFKKHGAEIIVAKRWDERKLAYEIKKQRRATYYLAYIKAAPDSLTKMNFDLKLSEPILRHLILRVEEIPAEAYEPEKEFQVEASSDSDGSEAAKSEKASEEEVVEVVTEEIVSEVVETTEGTEAAPADDSETLPGAEKVEEAPDSSPEGETKND